MLCTYESSFDIVPCESEVFKKRSAKIDIVLFQSGMAALRSCIFVMRAPPFPSGG